MVVVGNREVRGEMTNRDTKETVGVQGALEEAGNCAGHGDENEDDEKKHQQKWKA